MADLLYTAAAAVLKPPAYPVVAYGAHNGVNLPAHDMRLMLDDLIEDLHAVRGQLKDMRTADLVDTIALGLAASASVVTFADLAEFPGWPGDAVMRADGGECDGYDALRWLAGLLRRAGGMN